MVLCRIHKEYFYSFITPDTNQTNTGVTQQWKWALFNADSHKLYAIIYKWKQSFYNKNINWWNFKLIKVEQMYILKFYIKNNI